MGRLVVIDGLDGAGKHTQALKLKGKFLSEGKEVKLLSFPTYGSNGAMPVCDYLDGKLSDDPNKINPYVASSLFAVDRVCSFLQDWKNLYEEENSVIICDRYTTANAIHQLAKLPQKQWDKFLKWLIDYEWNKLSLPKPDLVVFLETTPEISLSLVTKRAERDGRKIDIHENLEFLTNSYNAGKYAAEVLNWTVINCVANSAMRNENSIFNEISNLEKIKEISTSV